MKVSSVWGACGENPGGCREASPGGSHSRGPAGAQVGGSSHSGLPALLSFDHDQHPPCWLPPAGPACPFSWPQPGTWEGQAASWGTVQALCQPAGVASGASVSPVRFRRRPLPQRGKEDMTLPGTGPHHPSCFPPSSLPSTGSPSCGGVWAPFGTGHSAGRGCSGLGFPHLSVCSPVGVEHSDLRRQVACWGVPSTMPAPALGTVPHTLSQPSPEGARGASTQGGQ